ncbi:MAG: hypothetical protein EBT15_04850 [Betaproteobacteria bacterium]|nr:hypothetical protein [Betaproteobacteria bacterium]
MGFPTCLIGRQHHLSALATLGVAPEHGTFPAVVDCPLCQQNTLHLFDDPTTAGVWLHCNSCLAHGDIITFAASVWNTSLPAAINKFVDQQLITPAEKDNMAEDFIAGYERHQKAENFWLDAEAQIWNHSDDVIALRVRELGVQHEINAAGLIGVAYQEQVEELCQTMRRIPPKSIRAKGASIVFPYYDLPGRLSGVLLIQYGEDFTDKRHFVPITGYKRVTPEAGYFLLRTALNKPTETLKNTQFIVDDPLWALTMQCEMLRRGLSLLPLMASYTGRAANSSGRSWSAFLPSPRIFHGQSATPDLISRTCIARGYLAVMPRDHKPKRRLDTLAMSQLAALRSRAETWQTCLQRLFGGMNEIAALSFASRLTIPPDKLVPFLQRVDDRFAPGFTDRVMANIKITPVSRTARAGWRWLVKPRRDGWWTTNDQRVCSANIVINKIIQSDNGERTYSGIIYLNDDEIPFTESAHRIESMGLFEFAAAHAAPHKKLITFDKRWNKRAHLISIELNQPEFVGVSSHVGWDERASVFRFANYEIRANGTIAPTPQQTTKNKSAVFPEPVAVAPPAIRQFLTPSPENAFTWSVVAAITANLVDVILRRETTATAITGPAYAAALQIGAALGCDELRSTYLRRSESTQQVYLKTKELEWPLFVSNVFDDMSLGPIVPKCHNRAIITRLSPVAAAAAPSYSWQVITGRFDANADYAPLRYVLPAYIQRALKNRMRLALAGAQTTAAVLADMHSWLHETYNATFQLAYAENRLITADKADIALFQELRTAVQDGKLDVLPQARKADQPTNYLLRKKDHWWLNQKAIDRYFYNGKALPPNWLHIVDLLTANNVFVGDEAVRNLPGILVSSAWCDQYLLPNLDLAREIG